MELKLELRSELREFADAMEVILRQYDRGKGNSWQTLPLVLLDDKLTEEYAECVLKPNLKEYVDLANICMMLWYRNSHPSDTSKGD